MRSFYSPSRSGRRLLLGPIQALLTKPRPHQSQSPGPAWAHSGPAHRTQAPLGTPRNGHVPTPRHGHMHGDVGWARGTVTWARETVKWDGHTKAVMRSVCGMLATMVTWFYVSWSRGVCTLKVGALRVREKVCWVSHVIVTCNSSPPTPPPTRTREERGERGEEEEGVGGREREGEGGRGGEEKGDYYFLHVLRKGSTPRQNRNRVAM